MTTGDIRRLAMPLPEVEETRDSFSPERIIELAEKAWCRQAPKPFAANYERGSSAPRRGLFLVSGPRQIPPGSG
jgi:hypothetical protein